MPRKKRSRDKVTGKKINKAKEEDSEVDELYKRIAEPHKFYTYTPREGTRSKKSLQRARKRNKVLKARNKRAKASIEKAPRILRKKLREASDGGFPPTFQRDIDWPWYKLFKVWHIDDPIGPFDGFCASLRKKGIGPNIKRLFHGTPGKSLIGICRDSLRVGGPWGLLGQGIYFTSFLAKAFSFSDHEHKFIIRADVALGRVCSMGSRRFMRSGIGWEEMQEMGYESSYAPPGKRAGVRLNYDEYCIYHPNQVQIISVAEYHKVE